MPPTLPVVVILGYRNAVLRVRALLQELDGRVTFLAPAPWDTPTWIKESRPRIVILANDDPGWVEMTLREHLHQAGSTIPAFVLTNRPGAFNNLFRRFAAATTKFFDDTTTSPMENWYSSKLLLDQVRAVLSSQKP